MTRLALRRRSLPEIEEIAGHDATLLRLADDATIAQTEVRDLARAQTKLDGDVEVVRQRMDRDQQRLDGGTVTSSKELVDLQTEVTSLKRRQATLEDEELDIMQSREDAESRLAGIEAARIEAGDQRAAAFTRRSEAETAIDAEIATTETSRNEVAPGLPADLLTLYDKVRASSGGVGAAALFRRRCEGCHLELGNAELRDAKAAAPTEVLRCENCRRILVRTPESGL